MKINFSEMAARRGVPLKISARLDADRLLGDRRDVLRTTPMQVELEASMASGIVMVDGHISGDIVFSCARCLDEVKRHMDVPFHEAFSHDEKLDDESDDDMFHISQDEFDLEPYLEAAFLLHVPFVALCREDCKGLCPVCGTNRNEEVCSCNTERIDPRLADLQKFFER